MPLANSSAVLKAYMTVSFYQEEMKGLSTASDLGMILVEKRTCCVTAKKTTLAWF